MQRIRYRRDYRYPTPPHSYFFSALWLCGRCYLLLLCLLLIQFVYCSNDLFGIQRRVCNDECLVVLNPNRRGFVGDSSAGVMHVKM